MTLTSNQWLLKQDKHVIKYRNMSYVELRFSVYNPNKKIFQSCILLDMSCSNLHTKVGELTVQVNTLYTLVTSDHNQIGQVVKHDQTINRQEVNTLINMQQQLSSKLQDIR